MNNLPIYVALIFGLTTLLTVYFLYIAANKSKPTIIILLLWLIMQAFISLLGFYTVTDTIPPRFLLLVLPPLLLIIMMFSTKKGRRYIDNLDAKTLTILHVIRIPVEVVLLWLFLNKVVPKDMTFEGRNFDIISGLTAPVVYYFGFRGQNIKRRLVLIWNFICLGLLINIVSIAVLSAPFPFQKLNFDQPDIAILYFPFTWLPCCIVPIVLFAHLAVIRQLIKSKNKNKRE